MPNNNNAMVTLRRWSVMQIEAQDGTKSRHVLGHDVANNLGRASSPVKEFNQETLVATTNSGSKYKLVGLPGESRLATAAWRKWCKEYGVVSETDVTKEYLNIDHVSTQGFQRIKQSLSE